MDVKIFIFTVTFLVLVVTVSSNNSTESIVEQVIQQPSLIIPGCITHCGYMFCSPKPITKAINAVTTHFASYPSKLKNLFSIEITDFENILQRTIDYLIVWVTITVIFLVIMIFTYPCYLKAIHSDDNYSDKNVLNL